MVQDGQSAKPELHWAVDVHSRIVRAARRAEASSLASGSEKPTAKVRIGSLTIGAIRAASPLESIPSDRNSPSGTSLIRWLRTAFASRARTLRPQSSRVPGAPSSVVTGNRQ